MFVSKEKPAEEDVSLRRVVIFYDIFYLANEKTEKVI